VPAGQGVQAAAPAASAYVPSGQGEQAGSPAFEKLPGAQPTQSADELAPVSRVVEPAGHAAHCGAPGASAKLPRPQLLHVVEPAAEDEPGAQGTHDELDCAPALGP